MEVQKGLQFRLSVDSNGMEHAMYRAHYHYSSEPSALSIPRSLLSIM